MKINELYTNFLEYRINIGNCVKTINEIRRFLTKPIDLAVGEIELDNLKLIHSANVRAAGESFGEFGPQRAILYYRQLLEYAHHAGHKINFDWREIKIPKVPDKRVEYLSSEELNTVRNLFPLDTAAGLRTRALIEFLLDTGLRISEAIAIDIKDIDFTKNEIQIKNVKTKEWGEVYINEDVSVEWLKKYIASRRDTCPALFVSGRGRLMAVSSRNYIRKMTKHLTFQKRICHHVFRRTLGTNLAQGGVDLKTVKDILRHKSERTTLRYYIGSDKERSKEKHKEVTSKMFSNELTPLAV